MVKLAGKFLGHQLRRLDIYRLNSLRGQGSLLNLAHEDSLSLFLFLFFSKFIKVIKNGGNVRSPFVFLHLLLDQFNRFFGDPWTKLEGLELLGRLKHATAESLLRRLAQLVHKFHLIDLCDLDADIALRSRLAVSLTLLSGYNLALNFVIFLLNKPNLIMVKLI